MNVIKLAIGSGILLLSCGAYSQSISEKTNSDKKGAAEFSPLSVSVGKTTSEQEALEKTGATSSRTTDKNLQSLDATVRSMPGTYTQTDPSGSNQCEYSRHERIWSCKHYGRWYYPEFLRNLYLRNNDAWFN